MNFGQGAADIAQITTQVVSSLAKTEEEKQKERRTYKKEMYFYLALAGTALVLLSYILFKVI
jgi:hypothetical protein